jgi:hypothetical protein
VLTIGFFGFYQEYVSRLLLLETTVEMQVSIAATIAKLETIKNLNKRYNPYTEVLEEDMVEWIREIQYVPQEDKVCNDPSLQLSPLLKQGVRRRSPLGDHGQ